MAINSFSTLKSAIADWLDRDDIPDAIDNMIGLMESRLYSELRVRNMLTEYSATIDLDGATTSFAIPSDFLEAHRFSVTGTPEITLEWRSHTQVTQQFPNRSDRGRPIIIGLGATDFITGPSPEDGTSIVGHYYARPDSLSITNETNFLTASWPNVLLYGTLVHSAPYLGQDPRAAVWETAYQDAFDRLQKAQGMSVYPHQTTLQAVAS